MKENIDPSVWINYFNECTRRNQWRPTHLQLFGELGAQDEAHGLPFAGFPICRDHAAAMMPLSRDT